MRAGLLSGYIRSGAQNISQFSQNKSAYKNNHKNMKEFILKLIDGLVKLLSEIRIALQGKKTYIVGLLFIALGLYYGEKEMVLEGLGFITLKAGLERLAK
jgi:hypothetical protein